MIRKYRGHIIILEHDTQDGRTAIRYDITSDTGQGAAVGDYGWFYELKSFAAVATECERIIDNAIAGDELLLAAGMVQ